MEQVTVGKVAVGFGQFWSERKFLALTSHIVQDTPVPRW